MLAALKRATYSARWRLAHSLCRSAAPSSHANQSFSAYGEDLIARAWLTSAGIKPHDVRYLDIGAAEPERISNTYLMAATGGSGILVEPDPDQAETLRAARPRDVVLNVGIAFDERRRARLYRLTSRVFNTFHREQAERIVEVSRRDWEPEQRQDIIDSIEVDLVPANTILRQHFDDGPHFLSIDTEGTNFEILQSIDFSACRPLVVCVEAGRPLCDYDQLLGGHGYSRICQTPDNLIFQRAI